MKKLLAALLLIAFAFGIAGCGQKSDELTDDPSQPVELVWYMIGPTPKDLDKVMAKVNEYTKDKLNATVKYVMIDFGDYNDKMKTLTQSGDNIDILFTCSWAFDYKQNSIKGLYYPLGELLDKYGKEMQQQMDPRIFTNTKINGVNYVIPSTLGTYQQGYVFNKKLTDKYGFDYASVRNESDMIPLLKQVMAANPGVNGLRHSSWIEDRQEFDYIFSASFPGAVRFTDGTCKVVNQFEQPEFINILKDARKMFEGGYNYQDYRKEGSDTDFAAGLVACEVYAIGPLQVSQADIQRVTKLSVVIQPAFDKPVVTTDSISGAMLAIPSSSKNPVRAMKLINLYNSDPYLHNLLCFGIEGVHYTKQADGRIHITEVGKDRYTMPFWSMGNQNINYVLDDQPVNYKQIMKDYVDSAVISPIFGFTFNPENVMQEVGSINNINDQYVPTMKNGMTDIDSTLKEYLSKVKAAGIDKVLTEMQKQVDAWKASKSK